MPQYACSSCKTGLYSAARAADLIDPRCPACGTSPGEARLLAAVAAVAAATPHDPRGRARIIHSTGAMA